MDPWKYGINNIPLVSSMAESYTPYLPSDLHPSILQNLPSKPLLKFLATSKSWFSLIKSPNFITTHLNQQLKSNNNNHRLFLLKSHKSFFFFRYGDPTGQRRLRLQSPPDGFDTIAASSHTLICLSNHGILLIWNPSINRFKSVPIFIDYDYFSHAFGLTHNNVCGGYGYKLVIIRYPKMSNLWDQFYPSPPSAQVYSGNNTLSWKQIILPTVDLVSRISTGFVVNGFIHWVVFRLGDDVGGDGLGFKEYGICILKFDPRDDCFAPMQLPTPLKEAGDPDLSLAVVDDRLAVIHLSGIQDSIRVWRMEEYGVEDSWKMSYEIKLSYVTNSKFWAEEHGKVFIATCSGKLIAFNPRKSRDDDDDDSGVYDGHLGMSGGQAFGFTQSLLLLNDN